MNNRHESLTVSIDGAVIAVVRSDRFAEILGACDPFQRRMGVTAVWLFGHECYTTPSVEAAERSK